MLWPECLYSILAVSLENEDDSKVEREEAEGRVLSEFRNNVYTLKGMFLNMQSVRWTVK